MGQSTTDCGIAVLGAGSWGTALAVVLARNGYRSFLWGHDAARMARIAHDRSNDRFLPGISFPEKLFLREDLPELARGCSRFLIAVPSEAFRATVEVVAAHARPDAIVATATKGLEPGSGRLLSEVCGRMLGVRRHTGVISGPTFAREVGCGLPAAMTVASADLQTAETIATWLRNDHLRVYTSHDLVGVQLGGAVKNVMAIAPGISDGLGLGANARAALITRGLAEIGRLGKAMGASPETFMGLAGMGDLVLTCTDDQSRNRRVGLALGRGDALGATLAALGQVAEGVGTAREVRSLAGRLGVDMPITEQVCRVLFEGVAPQDAVAALLRREPKEEKT